MQQTRICERCIQEKSLDEYYRCWKCSKQKDYICGDCRRKEKAIKASTPAGIYESKARILSNAMRPIWFPNQKWFEQCDHIFSIKSGHENNVPLNIIGNRNNLRLIPKRHNIHKGARNDQTLAQLYATAQPNERLERLAQFLEPITNPEHLLRLAILSNLWCKTTLAGIDTSGLSL